MNFRLKTYFQKIPPVVHWLNFLLIATWVMTTVIYLLNSFESKYNTHFGLIFSWIFVIIFCFAIYTPWLFRRQQEVSIRKIEFPLRDFWILVVIAGIGLIFHLIDKFYVRNYEFNGCISSIREAWLQDGIGRTGMVSSVWSALGHMLPGATAPAAVVLLSNFARLGSARLVALLSINSAILILYAMPIGSRSIITVYLSICISSFVVLWSCSQRSKRAFAKLIVTVLLAVGIPYAASVAYLFYDRITCSNTNDLKGYFDGYENELLLSTQRRAPVRPSSVSSDMLFRLSLGVSSLRDLIHSSKPETNDTGSGSVRLAGIYFSHGLWNFESNIHNSTRDPIIMFSPLMSWASRLLPIELPEGKLRAGKGSVALPGMLWISNHSFGIALGAIAFGLATLLAVAGILENRLRVLAFFTLIFIGTFLLISPIGSAATLLWFPFAAFATLIYGLTRRSA